MRVTLSMLRKALAGEIGMDAILDNVAYSLYNGQIPNVWRSLAPATCKGLGSWMDHFISRTKQYTDWVSSINCPGIKPSKLNVSLKFGKNMSNIFVMCIDWYLSREFTV